MRKDFAYLLAEKMRGSAGIFFLTGDLGFGLFERIFEEFPNRAFNCGASEQAMMDMAVGLSYEGKIPVVYSITPFLLYRPFETIRTYIDHEKLKVILVGSGRDRDYEHDNYSHWAEDASKILDTLPNIDQYYPIDSHGLVKSWSSILQSDKPSFLSLKR